MTESTHESLLTNLSISPHLKNVNFEAFSLLKFAVSVKMAKTTVFCSPERYKQRLYWQLEQLSLKTDDCTGIMNKSRSKPTSVLATCSKVVDFVEKSSISCPEGEK